jgi:hypothetical protein
VKIPAQKALFGAAYGIALVTLSVLIGGGGDGICLPAVISEAPLPFAASFPMYLSVWLVSTYSILGPLSLWAGIAALTQTSRRWLFSVAIAIHYTSAVFYVSRYWNDDFNDRYRNISQIVRYEGPYLVAFAAVYIFGQFWLWHSFVKYSPGKRLSSA